MQGLLICNEGCRKYENTFISQKLILKSHDSQLLMYEITIREKEKNFTNHDLSPLGPVSRKLRKLFGPEKPFLFNRYFKTERCIRVKLLV